MPPEPRYCAVCSASYLRTAIGRYCCSKECAGLLDKPLEEVEEHARQNLAQKNWKEFIRELDADRRKKR